MFTDRDQTSVALLEDLLSAVGVRIQQPRDARLERIEEAAARRAAPRLVARTRQPRRNCLRMEAQRPGGLRDRQFLAMMAVMDLGVRLVIDHGRLRSPAGALPSAPRMR